MQLHTQTITYTEGYSSVYVCWSFIKWLGLEPSFKKILKKVIFQFVHMLIILILKKKKKVTIVGLIPWCTSIIDIILKCD